MYLLILLALLGSPRFTVREAAQRLLTPATDLTLKVLEWHEARAPSPEVQCRCRMLVNAYYLLHAERLALALGPLPWLDAGIAGYNDYLAAASPGADGAGDPDYAKWASATRLWVKDRIAARLPYKGTLTRLWALELDYRLRHQPW